MLWLHPSRDIAEYSLSVVGFSVKLRGTCGCSQHILVRTHVEGLRESMYPWRLEYLVFMSHKHKKGAVVTRPKHMVTSNILHTTKANPIVCLHTATWMNMKMVRIKINSEGARIRRKTHFSWNSPVGFFTDKT